jgi:hypothetical protein
MTKLNEQVVRRYRDEAEATKDTALSPSATLLVAGAPKCCPCGSNPDEFDELAHYAKTLDVPASALVRGWILEQLRAGSESPSGCRADGA